ncbi:acyl-CoA dehydrogenase [Mucilaginibacter robiniae]|uniref:Acyl-CoA dehydrogenase n=1 Tax=Mucilaginibacter robiniae TaxID=2728022 RepID=A0A7L5DZH1_9SPHI|nr:acyl-CoA dehydrogenase [Mucilaginibacter robiniae]QJD96502.1 acyl-CoA dehydrogenase [Mucilaginibacter robiniae]
MRTEPHPSALLKPEWVSIIRIHAFAAEQQGELQPEQLELIYLQQWFKMLVPTVYGGSELPLPDMVRLEEALSWADGSLGWVITLCAGAAWFGGFIAPDAAKEIFANPKVCLAGSGASTGTANSTENSYLLNGSWKYASGVRHATHFTANCLVEQDEEVLSYANNNPLVQSFVVDAQKAELIPAWKYIGMMGTGSHAFRFENVEVPANRCFKIDGAAAYVNTPLYRYPFLQLAEATLAANLSGMAIHFVDLCEPVLMEKMQQPKLTEKQHHVLKSTLQEVKDNLQGIRAQFYHALDASWQAGVSAENIDDHYLKAVSNSSRLLAQIARESVDALYPYCGLWAASPDTELNLVWRDLHTASQHSLLTFTE